MTYFAIECPNCGRYAEAKSGIFGTTLFGTKEIDRLQKAILDIANKEEPFDIFICYKETAEDGQRTKSSVLATALETLACASCIIWQYMTVMSRAVSFGTRSSWDQIRHLGQ